VLLRKFVVEGQVVYGRGIQLRVCVAGPKKALVVGAFSDYEFL